MNIWPHKMCLIESGGVIALTGKRYRDGRLYLCVSVGNIVLPEILVEQMVDDESITSIFFETKVHQKIIDLMDFAPGAWRQEVVCDLYSSCGSLGTVGIWIQIPVSMDRIDLFDKIGQIIKESIDEMVKEAI